MFIFSVAAATATAVFMVVTTAAAAAVFVMTVASAATAAASALVGQIRELAAHHKLGSVVCVAAEARKCYDAVLGKSLPCTGANIADDNSVNTAAIHEVCNSLVAALLDLDKLLGNELGILFIRLVDRKHLGMAEVLKNLVVFVCYCNYHGLVSFFYKVRHI